MTTQRPLSGRLALVTGASRGLGRAVALELAKQGAHIIAVGRTVGALESLDDEIQQLGGQSTLSPFDLRDPTGIEHLTSIIAERWGHLDILVGNAGILGDLTPVADITPKVWAEAFDLNVTANWRLIRALDPFLRLSPAGRAVFITSGAADKPRAFWGLYATTKAALNAIVLTYAQETQSTTLRVNLVSPGPLRTDMRAKAMPGERPDSLRPPSAIAPAIVELLSPAETRTGQVIDMRDIGANT